MGFVARRQAGSTSWAAPTIRYRSQADGVSLEAMNLRIDRLNCTPLDRCVSTSGKYTVWLLQRFSPGGGHLTEYSIGISLTSSSRLLKMVHVGMDNLGRARDRYDEFKRLMTERAGPQESDLSLFDSFKERKEVLPMPKLIPV